MASKVWIGNTSGNEHNYATAANWSPSGVPADADDIVFNGQATTYIDGSDQSAIEPASIRVYKSCAYNIGSAATPLLIGPTLVEIGLESESGGNESGPPTIAFDFGSDQVNCIVHDANNSGESGFSCVLIRGTNGSNKLDIRGGSVGIGTMVPAEATTFTQIDVSGETSNVTIGYNVTLATLNQRAGTVHLGSACTTINQDGGTLTSRGSGTITTANILGTFVANSTGTITTLNVSGNGTADFSRSPAARTVTNCNVYGTGATVNADNNASAVTFTNGVDCREGAKTTQVNFGDGVTVTPSAL